jgi:hypothetical protein
MPDQWSEEAKRIQEKAVHAMRMALERMLGDDPQGYDLRPMFLPPEEYSFIDIKAECTTHGDVRVVNEGGRAFCFECVKACREGRCEEVVSIGKDGAIVFPDLLLYPDEPINYIAVTFKVAGDD